MPLSPQIQPKQLTGSMGDATANYGGYGSPGYQPLDTAIGNGIANYGGYGSQGYNPTESSTPTNANGTSTGTTNGSGLLSGLSGVGNSISSLLGSNAGSLATYGGLYALLASQANSAESENDQLAGQISAVGQPAVGESQNLLGAYSQGQLTAPYQTQVQAAENANQNTAISEGQQSAQLLANSGGGQNTQSALGSQSQQIQNAQNQANTAAVSTAFQNELTSSNSLLSAGGPYVAQGVTQEISSNTQLQGQLSSLMSNLASAYAQQVSGNSKAATTPSTSSKPSTSGGSGSGGSGSGGSGSGSASSSAYSGQGFNSGAAYSETGLNYGSFGYGVPSSATNSPGDYSDGFGDQGAGYYY